MRKEPVLVVGLDLLVLLLEVEGDLHWGNSFLLAFGLIWR